MPQTESVPGVPGKTATPDMDNFQEADSLAQTWGGGNRMLSLYQSSQPCSPFQKLIKGSKSLKTKNLIQDHKLTTTVVRIEVESHVSKLWVYTSLTWTTCIEDQSKTADYRLLGACQGAHTTISTSSTTTTVRTTWMHWTRDLGSSLSTTGWQPTTTCCSRKSKASSVMASYRLPLT